MIARVVALLLMGAYSAFAGELVDRPEHCLRDHVFPCAIGSSTRSSLTLKHEKTLIKIGLGAGSKVLLYSPREAALIDGEVAFLSEKHFRLRHGAVKIEIEARALVSRKDRELEIVVLEGTAKIRKPTGVGEVLVSGLKQTVGSLDAVTGEVATKVAEPYEFAKTSVRWLKLAALDREGVAGALKTFRALWKTSVEVAAQGYAGEMGRQLASKEKKVEAELDEEELLRRRNLKLRELFRKKSLDSEGEISK